MLLMCCYGCGCRDSCHWCGCWRWQCADEESRCDDGHQLSIGVLGADLWLKTETVVTEKQRTEIAALYVVSDHHFEQANH